MGGIAKTINHLNKLGVGLLAALLLACSGGTGTDSTGGPVGGQSSGVGLDGGNFAAGPVDLPVPVDVSRDAPEDLHRFSCRNLGFREAGGGPLLRCQGRDYLTGMKFSFSVLPAGSIGLQAFFDWLVPTVHASGFFQQMIVGDSGKFEIDLPVVAGQVVQIHQVFRPKQIDTKLSFEVPPIGETVVLPRISNGLPRAVFTDRGGRWQLSDRGVTSSEQASHIQAARCEGESIPAEIYFRNTLAECRVEYFAPLSGEASYGVNIPKCSPREIVALLEFQDPDDGQRYLAIAINNRLHLAAIGAAIGSNSRIIKTIEFPYLVTGVQSSAAINANLFVLLGNERGVASSNVIAIFRPDEEEVPEGPVRIDLSPPKVRMSTPRLYHVDAKRSRAFRADCLPGQTFLNGLQRANQFLIQGGTFLVAGKFESLQSGSYFLTSSEYRVLAGQLSSLGNFIGSPKVISQGETPSVSAILSPARRGADLATLFPAENRIEFTRFSTGGRVNRQSVALGDLPLRSGGGSLETTSPVRLHFHRALGELAFLDIGQAGVSLVRLPLLAPRSDGQLRIAGAEVRNLGKQIPSWLHPVMATGQRGWVLGTDGEWNFIASD